MDKLRFPSATTLDCSIPSMGFASATSQELGGLDENIVEDHGCQALQGQLVNTYISELLHRVEKRAHAFLGIRCQSEFTI